MGRGSLGRQAELRSRAIAEREVAIKCVDLCAVQAEVLMLDEPVRQTREKRAKLYGQAFDLIHGLRQFGCHLEHLDGDFPSDDASISRAKFIEASIADAELSHRVLCDELALVDDPDAGTLTLPLSNIFKSSNGSEKDQTPQTANQSQAQVAALSESQAQNTANEHRFKSPALEPQERPFSHYAMDRHSPSFNPHSLPNPTTNFALPPAASTTVDPSNTLTHKVANDAPLRMPDDHYLDRLPPLPANLQRNRVAVGGLLRRKREKDGEKTGSALSGGMELYKSGLLHASLLSVRHLLGTPPDDSNIDPKLRQVRPAKVVMSDDWKVAYRELEMQRALERIEVLKSQSKWSFRQPRKQKGPHVHKTHWDYLLDEMVLHISLCPTSKADGSILSALDAHRLQAGAAVEASGRV